MPSASYSWMPRLSWPVELGPEESRRRFQELVRSPQLRDRPAQPLHLGVLRARHPRSLAGVHLCSADPLAHRLRRRTDLRRDRLDRGPLRVVLGRRLGDQPHRLRLSLRQEPDTWHGLHLLADRSPYETQDGSVRSPRQSTSGLAKPIGLVPLTLVFKTSPR